MRTENSPIDPRSPAAGQTVSFYASSDIAGAIDLLFGGKRGEKSAWFEVIARKDLMARGALPFGSTADDLAELMHEVRACVAAQPVARVREVLAQFRMGMAEVRGEEAAAKP